MNTEKLISFILFFPGFLFSLSFHEAAHGWMANKCGDRTAKFLGRVTLNPLPHMDPIGTLLLPTLGFFFGGFLIGWGKPVPVDYRNLRHWKRDSMWVALAGPVSNLLLAILIAIAIHTLSVTNPDWFNPQDNFNGYTILSQGILQMFFLNLTLTFFNLIPVHPLDGGKIIYGILPQPYANQFDHFVNQYGVYILLGLFLTGIYKILVWAPVQFVSKILL